MVNLDSKLVLSAIHRSRVSQHSFWEALVAQATIEGHASTLYSEDMQSWADSGWTESRQSVSMSASRRLKYSLRKESLFLAVALRHKKHELSQRAFEDHDIRQMHPNKKQQKIGKQLV